VKTLGKATNSYSLISFLPLSSITYISIAMYHIPRNISCYVSATSWAEYAGKRKIKHF
jgi:hypothetical protein